MRSVILAAIAAAAMAPEAGATTVDFVASYGLSNDLAAADNNHHPQGLGYDAAAGELLFMQQNAFTIYSTDLTGVVQSSRSIAQRYTTSVAADATRYYYTDYTANAGGIDLYAIDKTSGSETAFSTEIAGYGGYPIDVRDGKLYRTEASTGYSWSNLDQLRISSLSTPDTIDTVLTLATPFGIGDIAIDLDRNVLWTLDYAAAASIREFDLTSGLQLAEFDLDLDGLAGGLTYADDRLYHYDWNTGSGSTLSVYSLGATAVPLPASGLLLAAGLGAVGWMRRRG